MYQKFDTNHLGVSVLFGTDLVGAPVPPPTPLSVKPRGEMRMRSVSSGRKQLIYIILSPLQTNLLRQEFFIFYTFAGSVKFLSDRLYDSGYYCTIQVIIPDAFLSKVSVFFI